MSLKHLPALLATVFVWLGRCLHPKTALRLPHLLKGLLLACGRRRTVTTWIQAAGLQDDFRQCYVTVAACGRCAPELASVIVAVVQPLCPSGRLLMAIDDSPTKRAGEHVQGASIHHHPSPSPAGEKFLYGHVFVTLAALCHHPTRGTVALPIQAQLYVRQDEACALAEPVPFRTKLQIAAEQLRWLTPRLPERFQKLWVAVDGGYAKRPFLKPCKGLGWVVVSRLRKDAHLCDLPPQKRAPGRRGPMPTYGKNRIDLAEQAADKSGWQQVECLQYGEPVSKTAKTLVCTWRPAGGAIKVVLVKEEKGVIPFFSTDPEATPAEILEAAADRNALEQSNKEVKEVWGAGEQQVRKLDRSLGCYNLNLWMATLTEVWSWDKTDEELVDRKDRPWDREARRPSHNDKRKALQREVLEGEILDGLAAGATQESIRGLADRLLDLFG